VRRIWIILGGDAGSCLKGIRFDKKNMEDAERKFGFGHFTVISNKKNTPPERGV
jgi:hypothetical protein